MNIHVHHHSYDQAIFTAILRRLDRLALQGEKTMTTLQNIVDDMAKQTTLINGIQSLVSGLKQQLADALAGTVLAPSVQAQIDQIFAEVEANNAALETAAAIGTPVAKTVQPIVPPVVAAGAAPVSAPAPIETAPTPVAEAPAPTADAVPLASGAADPITGASAPVDAVQVPVVDAPAA